MYLFPGRPFHLWKISISLLSSLERWQCIPRKTAKILLIRLLGLWVVLERSLKFTQIILGWKCNILMHLKIYALPASLNHVYPRGLLKHRHQRPHLQRYHRRLQINHHRGGFRHQRHRRPPRWRFPSPRPDHCWHWITRLVRKLSTIMDIGLTWLMNKSRNCKEPGRSAMS